MYSLKMLTVLLVVLLSLVLYLRMVDFFISHANEREEMAQAKEIRECVLSNNPTSFTDAERIMLECQKKLEFASELEALISGRPSNKETKVFNFFVGLENKLKNKMSKLVTNALENSNITGGPFDHRQGGKIFTILDLLGAVGFLVGCVTLIKYPIRGSLLMIASSGLLSFTYGLIEGIRWAAIFGAIFGGVGLGSFLVLVIRREDY